MSRRHAMLRIADDGLEIVDLGSANGTKVASERIAPDEPVRVALDETFELGSVSALIQRRAARPRPRRLWPHGYFEGRVEDECARADRDRSSFAVIVARCGDAAPNVHEVLARVLQPTDVAGEYGAGEYEILAIDVTPTDAELRAQALARALAEHGIEARTGVACYPRDGRSPDALIAVAHDAARGEQRARPAPSDIIVRSEPMRQLHDLVARFATGDISVLLLGETGVGKEIMAEVVHRRSHRADAPLVRINCGALTESLLESELFGHERGAFTGAAQTKPGLLETAAGGSVFLDEIGELPMSTQVKLLRVLEEKRVLRVGGLKPRPIDVRFIAATNRDLEAEIARGRFREDLYYRLNGVSLVIPPLRERVEEIEPLARAFADDACRRGHRPPAHIAAAALEALRAYSWPGNIRELRNVMERAVLLAGDSAIAPEHLPLEKMRATRRPAPPAEPAPPAAPPAPTPAPAPAAGPAEIPPAAGWWEENADARERERIVEALRAAEGNQTRAAQLLGISRRTLLNRLDKYQIPRPRKKTR